LHASRVVAVVILPDLPGDGLGAAGVGRFGEFLADDFDLIEGVEGGYLVFEEALVVSVFPASVFRVVRVADEVVFDAVADLHHVFLKFERAAGKIFMDHRLLQRVGDGDEHRGVLAGRVFRLVVLGSEGAASFVQLDEGKFPGARDAVRFDVQNRYAFHGALRCLYDRCR